MTVFDITDELLWRALDLVAKHEEKCKTNGVPAYPLNLQANNVSPDVREKIKELCRTPEIINGLLKFRWDPSDKNTDPLVIGLTEEGRDMYRAMKEHHDGGRLGFPLPNEKIANT